MTTSINPTEHEIRRTVKSEVAAIFRSGPSQRTLWLTTFAFFLTFVIWFNMAPFALSIAKTVGLNKLQIAALLLCNLVLAVPGRVLAGRLLDRYGPRRLFGWLLIFSAVPNSIFAFSHTFMALAISRLALGLVGSGFVIGIRLVAEWYDREHIGIAEGFYGGWGNFGSAGAALLLPTLASLFVQGPDGWRWAVFVSGLVGAGYGLAFMGLVKDAPDGRPFVKAKSASSLEVSSKAGLVGLLALQVPLIMILGVVVNRLKAGHVFSPEAAIIAYILLAALLVYQSFTAISLNRPVLKNEQLDSSKYPFSSVVLLSLTYAVTFGTELTMVSLLPTYFATTFGLKVAAAGVAGSAFAFTNLVTRPGGGIFSDLAKSRSRTLSIFLFGSAVSFFILAQLKSSWPLIVGIVAVALTSIFIQGGNGATFAMVPGIRKDITGQVAGIVGAYGNVGGLVLSSILYYTATKGSVGDVHLMFLAISGAALIVGVLCRVFLKENTISSLPHSDEKVSSLV